MKKAPLIILTLVICVIFLFILHQNNKSNNDKRLTNTDELKDQFQLATFAGGCFWCTESDFEKVIGVHKVVSGYTGGEIKNPTYNEVSSGSTGHRESIQVFYDESLVNYETLLDVFWTHVNPTDNEGQFSDRGLQYSPAIFFHNDYQKTAAQDSMDSLNKLGKFNQTITTPIIPAGEFYIAEDYHQDYYSRNPIRYNYYREGSGRNEYIKETWGNIADNVITGEVCVTNTCKSSKNNSDINKTINYQFIKPSDSELKDQLTKIQYAVTQNDGTESPFKNEYWDNHKDGIYVDIVSGEPLFSSTDKFDSGTGWPSFLKPIEAGNVVEYEDYSFFQKRIEIRSKVADSHLGHIILDGPEENNYVRYCINSAALNFIPRENLTEENYKKYEELFK